MPMGQIWLDADDETSLLSLDILGKNTQKLISIIRSNRAWKDGEKTRSVPGCGSVNIEPLGST